MINKDYILRLAERLGRELAILVGLRKREKYQEALIYIDDLLLRVSGFHVPLDQCPFRRSASKGTFSSWDLKCRGLLVDCDNAQD